ncbi:hypothetical protein VTK73DRAFT_4235 [Phialemonium thermophilum]|uniref:ABC transmembrane type-1 domain-containing protein n=1 Tax=Phialemonium thermophilum TaxID=223376 RepID=A0ABR3VBQ4_9PEZI
MTVVSIAHRLSTVRNADHIIVLQDGQVAEQGTYEQLIAMDGVFAHLASLQSLGRWDEDGNGSSQRGYGSSGSSSSSLTQADLAGKELVVAASQEEQPPDDADGVESGSQTTSTAAIPTAPLAQTLRSIASILRPSLLWLAVALFAATIVGGTFSGSGLIFGFTVGALNPCDHETSRILSLGRFFGGLLFMLAVIELVANFAAWSAFGLLAERLLYVLRVLSFRSLLEQPLDWHQSGGRSPSGLLAIITKDGAAVGGFSGSIIGTVFSIVVNFVAAIVLSHIIAWKIAVVCLVVVPVLLGAGVMQLRQLARYEARHADAHAQANGIAVEAVGSIQTIASLSLEQEVLGTYKRALHAPGRDMVVQSALANVWLALSNSTSFLVYAFAYWWGARLIMKGEYSQRQFFIILVAMLVSAQLWGQMFTLAPEFSRARTAAARIFGTISMGSSTRVDRLGPSDGGAVAAGAEPSEEDVEASGKSQPGSAAGGRGAHVAFDKVCFSYASRPDAPVLQDVSFTVRPGQFCGLVGPSGAGKSTILKLVQGIYTATSGTVSIDGVDLARSKQNDPIRDAIAIVPQDPALFDGD